MNKGEQAKITQEELDSHLTQHALWLRTNKEKGITLSLSNYDLSYLSFEKAQLTGANLSRCNMSYSNFSFADLESINVTESDFRGANLYCANLKRSDCKYIVIDEHTNFEDAIYEGMMIDSPTAEFLPVYMDRNVMQIVEEYRVQLNFSFPKETAHIGRGILDDFSDILQAKYDNSRVRIRSERKDFQNMIVKIEAENPEDVEKIQKDIFDFQRILRGDKSIMQLTEDPILIERFNINQKFREFQIQHQRQILEIGGMLNDVKSTVLTLEEVSNNMSMQLRQNLLPQGPQKNEHADCIVTLANGNRKAIDAEKVICIEKNEGIHPIVYTTDEIGGFKVDELMSALSAKLSRVSETIMVSHKKHIINLKYIKKKVNDGNNYIVYCNELPNKELMVGQNHKKLFNELIAAHNIALDAV